MQTSIPMHGKRAAPRRPLASGPAVGGGIAAASLAQSRMPVWPVVALLALSTVFAGASRILSVEATWPLFLVYAAWGIAAAILLKKSFSLRAAARDRWSPATV